MTVRFGVLGPLRAWDERGRSLPLKGPRHRAVLARLLVAHGRLVPLDTLIDDLWEEEGPPAGAASAVRTFVAALRRALEPERAPRAPARLLVTEGPGYALRVAPETVDALVFERTVTGAQGPPDEGALERALEAWRGPAYADVAHTGWARAERARLVELRSGAVEELARLRLARGATGRVIADLDAHVTDHPWREEAWYLLASALYRADRQAEALAVLQRARTLLADRLGLDPGRALGRLEQDILRQSEHHDPRLASAGTAPVEDERVDRLWHSTARAYEKGPGTRTRLESTVGLLRSLALTGADGLRAARDRRSQTIDAALASGDADLTARIIGAYDVPAVWTGSDDPEQAARVVRAAEQALSEAGPAVHPTVRARLLATVALESRGSRGERPARAAAEAERIARDLADPALTVFALNARWMQTFSRPGLSRRRGRIGTELVELSERHGLDSFEILGHLIGVQTHAAHADVEGADHHAHRADALARRHERPLVGVFTDWYRALRLDLTGQDPERVARAYRAAAERTRGAGMPGLERGLAPLALLCLRVRHGLPWRREAERVDDWGPHLPWVRPLLLASEHPERASAVLAQAPAPVPGLLMEAHWGLLAHAALALGERPTLLRTRTALEAARGEHAGAASGLFTLGSVDDLLDRLQRALGAG
ncbi:BTAD domain-containing putative transcriptional regulator [Nocardiopsis alba]|uniref:AfsR/SARP family transcriptional regulator n=1 Tax=Nocardiopsis alba TaxID=53437 RepID=UPI00367013CE